MESVNSVSATKNRDSDRRSAAIRINPEVWRAVKIAAAEDGGSASGLVEAAVTDYLMSRGRDRVSLVPGEALGRAAGQ